MRKFLSLCFVTTLALSAFSQKEPPVAAFGKIEKAELEMKEFPMDKNAAAVALYDIGELYCSL
ncbi:MAG: hypothetical protein H7Y27_15420, partial [Gemmatimonadaceae bacterium]|nr:hypothetical protein [Chitinophagaceae bacterium]